MATPPPLAVVDDLVVRLGQEFADDVDQDRAAAVLDDASVLVRDESGKDWLDPDDPTELVSTMPGIVRVITLRVAERAIRNPEGLSSESAGDYSYQRNGTVGEGGLFLTEKECASLRRAAGGRSKLWNQPVTRNEPIDTVVWFNTMPGSEPIPLDTYID